jgi:beta-galactosidase
MEIEFTVDYRHQSLNMNALFGMNYLQGIFSVRGVASAAVLVALLCMPGTVWSADASRERLLFNEGWLFTQGDPEGVGDRLDYDSLKPWLLPTANAFIRDSSQHTERPEGNIGEDVPYTQPEFDDSGWRRLNLPHDWAIEGPFMQEYPGETAKVKWWGPVWYRKHFTLPESDAGRRIYLDVDGAMSFASVWCNGQFVGGWPYGYSSWRVDLTPFVKTGRDNVIAIRLDSPEESSRWYPGGGIYRNVWLVKTAPFHIAHWGIHVITPQISQETATIQVQTTIENRFSFATVVALQTEIFEMLPDGSHGRNSVASIKSGIMEIAADSSTNSANSLVIPRPKLWSLAKPTRYIAVTTLESVGQAVRQVVDRVETPFGIRTFEFTPEDGFSLNGERIPLNGVNMHHDLGALGAAFNTRAAERQLEILRGMGCNAIRTAHNPPAPEFLDLCDRMGFVVIDESFDTWRGRKKRNDYHLLFPDWSEADLRAMVRRDRNHPSIIAWSTGNEMPDMRNEAGVELSKKLTAIVKEEDSTRPVTAGCNHDVAGFNGFQHTVDVFGYNYKPQLFASFHATNPEVPLYSSESASTVSSRGEYFFPVTHDKLDGRSDFQISSYDLYAPTWANQVEREWRFRDEHPFVLGEFVWSGFDYLGEPTPYNSDLSNLQNYTDPAERERARKQLEEIGKIRVPSRSSYFGIIDLAGFPKDRFYLYQSRWRPDLPMAHILPHWNWPERIGEVTPVHVYTSGDEAELFLNGESLGRKQKGRFEYRLRWDDVVYEPGELKVVAYKNGKRWATDVLKTTGPAAKLVLEADRRRITANGLDLSFVTVSVADKDGLLAPRSDNRIHFKVEGPGEIVATDNGDPTSHESFQLPERKAFNGVALVIVRAKSGEPGRIRLTAEADGLRTDVVTIRAVRP